MIVKVLLGHVWRKHKIERVFQIRGTEQWIVGLDVDGLIVNEANIGLERYDLGLLSRIDRPEANANSDILRFAHNDRSLVADVYLSVSVCACVKSAIANTATLWYDMIMCKLCECDKDEDEL